MASEEKFKQYFCTRPKLGIIMPNGKRIAFVAGYYVTSDEEEIKFLDGEVKLKHPMIYVKAGQEVVTKEQLDPLNAIKEKIIKEHEAAKAAGGSTGTVTSTSVGAVAAESKSK